MRVLFVGSELNPLSIAVFESLVRARLFDLYLLASQPHRRGLVPTFRRVYQEEGMRKILQGGFRLLYARSRMILQQFGIHRGRPASLSEVASRNTVKVISCTSVNAAKTLEILRPLEIDVILVAAFDQILKRPVLDLPRLGCVNVHPSLLPAHRGANPFYWVIQQQDAQTGVSFHLIDEGIDTGPLLQQAVLKVTEQETERTLQQRSAQIAADLAPQVLQKWMDGSLRPVPQPEEGASYDPKPPRGASRL